jgi:hypothetical protein
MLHGVILLGLTVYAWRCLRRLYEGEVWGFHDLTLINDLLANTVHEGRPFHITAAARHYAFRM